MESLKSLIQSDLKVVFMNEAEFAGEVSFFHNSIETPVTIQLFEEFQDFRTPTYFRLWCDLSDIPNITINDYFVINGKKYSVVSFVIDEMGNGLTVFSNKDDTWQAV